MKLYKIKDWATLYENNRTRELKNMAWVPVPNSHDGDGYTELVDRKNGAAILGAWLVILQVASRCDPRGTLLRDGAVPHDGRSLARMTRLPREVIEEALEICTKQVKWIDVVEVATIPQEGAGIPQDGALEQNGTEGNRTEWNGVVASLPTATKPASATRMDRPTREAVELQATKIGLPLPEVDKFMNHYESNGWRVGKNPMRSWPHALSNWKANLGNYAHGQAGTVAAPTAFSLSKIIEAKRALAADLKNKHAIETGLDTTWNDPAARTQYRSIMQEIKQLTAKLGGMA